MPWVESSSNLSTFGEGSVVSSEGLSFEVSRANAAGGGGQPRMVDTPMSDDYGMVTPEDQQQQNQQGYSQQQQHDQQQYGQVQQDQQYVDGSQQVYGSESQQDQQQQQQQQQHGGSEQSPEGYGEGQQQTEGGRCGQSFVFEIIHPTKTWREVTLMPQRYFNQ